MSKENSRDWKWFGSHLVVVGVGGGVLGG